MCTIMSVSKAFFQANGQAVLDQLRADARSNSDGFGLLTCGKYADDAVMMKAKSVDAVEHALCFLDWDRAWVHCRTSTTSNETLGDCHPFVAYDSGKAYYIMHNGILSGHGANSYRVDSTLIADIINDYGVHAAVAHLLEKQHFANVFIVCPEKGEWYVSRSSGGTLHTDGAGNYSSKSFGQILEPVKASTLELYQEKVEQPKEWKPNYNYGSSYSPRAEFPPTSKEEPSKEDELPASLKRTASAYLMDDYDAINDSWERWESTRYHRM